MLKRLLPSLALVVIFVIATCNAAAAATRVWLLYGFGDNAFGTSSGIDDIAARARSIPGVVAVNVRNYWETQRTADEILAAPANDRIVVGGYSCGLNGATVVARGLNTHRKVHSVVGIQQSKWCGGDALEGNVKYGQSTFNADCRQTFGLGCKPLEPAPSFLGKIVNIDRPDSHGAADNDPDAQADVLKAIAATSLYGHVPPPRPERDCRWAWTSERGWAVLCTRPPADGRVREIIRYRGH